MLTLSTTYGLKFNKTFQINDQISAYTLIQVIFLKIGVIVKNNVIFQVRVYIVSKAIAFKRHIEI